MSRTIRFLAIALALIAAACGGDDAADTTLATTAAPTTVAPTTTAAATTAAPATTSPPEASAAVVLAASALGDILTDQDGNTLVWTSGGTVGFKGSRKSTPYAAQVAAEQAARRAGEYGMRKVDVIVRGSGSGRETAIRTLQTMGMEVTGIRDITPIPHNGVRLKKRRRG